MQFNLIKLLRDKLLRKIKRIIIYKHICETMEVAIYIQINIIIFLFCPCLFNKIAKAPTFMQRDADEDR